VAVIAVAAWDLYLRPAPSPAEVASGETATLELPDKPSIAVLAFDNLSGDPEQEYLSDGITESLITRLAKQPDMFVIARNSSFTYKGKAVRVQQVGRELGVRYVLEGSVQKAGERIRITAQLIEAATGEHLWADSYDRELQDLFAVQDEITQKVAIELAVQLTVGESARSDFQATDNVEAYEYWLRGVEAYRLFKKETNVQAGELFEKAIELDPQYARAIGWLGWVRLNESRWWWGEDRDRSFRQAEELARRAIAIDENSPGAHSLLARIYSHKGLHEEAIAEGRRTVAIEPSSAPDYSSLAWTMVLAGRPEDGLAPIRKALRLSPYPPIWFRNVETNINYLTGRYEAAIASGRKLLDRTLEGTLARGTWRKLIASYVELGREAEARAEAEKYLEKYPDFSVQEDAEWLRGFIFKDKSWIERYIDALRKAGLPE
jgi:adenylate cyclase